MSNNVKESTEDKEYQVFSNLMDAVFEMGEELHDRIEEGDELTDVEYGFLDALDDYVNQWQEELDKEENDKNNENN